MPSLSEQLRTVIARANDDTAFRDSLLQSPADALADAGVALRVGVTATAEYHDGYGVYVELKGIPAAPVKSRPALDDPLLDCLHH